MDGVLWHEIAGLRLNIVRRNMIKLLLQIFKILN